MREGVEHGSEGLTPTDMRPRTLDRGPSMRFGTGQLRDNWLWTNFMPQIEHWLEMERDNIPLWVPVAVGTGIISWFAFPELLTRIGLICAVLGFATLLYFSAASGRLTRVVAWACILSAMGMALMWIRGESVASPVLERPVVTRLYANIDHVEQIPARDMVRLTLKTGGKQDLPPKVRVNVPMEKASPELKAGALIELRARLMPPATAALPGAYNFAERAWFSGLGASGQLIGDIKIIKSSKRSDVMADVRQDLSSHVRVRMDGGAGAIAATLATGDRGAISEENAEAMRRSGLAHLLSISGLHVTAVVGATYMLVLKLLAFSPWLALRFRLPIVAAGCAAAAALSYTLLTGAQVPTIRACVAAILVLVALMVGRSAITLRMVAAGALFVMIFWPESLMGPSFQLSFAAVTAIIALHEWPPMKRLSARREENWLKRFWRAILILFLTGLVVEIALMPIALYHFHKSGIYGALANIIAIPLTTFVIMPFEALALLADTVGAGAPFWWVCQQALDALLALAHFVESRPGSVMLLPTMSKVTFGLLIFGGLWICLWRTRLRLAGLMPVMLGLIFLVNARAPDIYITGDGRHLALRNASGDIAFLRTRSGDFVKTMLIENAGVGSEPEQMEDWPGAKCNADSCVMTLSGTSVGNVSRDWKILATRSAHYIPAMELAAACARVDIVVSDRNLPKSCAPKWFKADRWILSQTGGMTINLKNHKIETVRSRTGNHPWMRFRSILD